MNEVIEEGLFLLNVQPPNHICYSACNHVKQKSIEEAVYTGNVKLTNRHLLLVLKQYTHL